MNQYSNRIFSALSLPLALISLVSAHATPIEGATEKAKMENAKALESVIKIKMGAFMSAGVCTSTLISKNILLTARHCVPNLHPGNLITLNNDSNYRVSQVIAQPDMVYKTENHATKTDIALILFQADDCARSNLSQIEPLALANQKNRTTLSNRVLIAGYGQTTPTGEASDKINAGYNQWIVSDYSQTADPKLSAALKKFMVEDMGEPENQLALFGHRDQQVIFENKKGKPLSIQAGTAEKMEEESALSLHGDSGGPAIAFDSDGAPFIVGVTSGGNPDVRPDNGVLLALDRQKKLIAKIEVKAGEDGMGEATNQLLDVLTKAGVISSKQIANQDFIVANLSSRLALDDYTSTSNTVNDAFLKSSLSILENVRDTAGNFCQ